MKKEPKEQAEEKITSGYIAFKAIQLGLPLEPGQLEDALMHLREDDKTHYLDFDLESSNAAITKLSVIRKEGKAAFHHKTVTVDKGTDHARQIKRVWRIGIPK